MDGTIFDRVKLVREEIRFEHDVMARRLNALTASQSFLVAAFSFTRGHGHEHLPCIALATVGLASSVLVMLAVWVGECRLMRLRRSLGVLSKEDEDQDLVDLVCPLGFRAQALSQLYAFGLPVLCALGWLAIGAWLWLERGAVRGGM